jgi:uncharacterized protein (TIGR00255 family)
MTGFGAASGAVDGIEYTVEIKSVNNRYFKPSIKLPESWSRAEAELESKLRQVIARGTVTVTLRMRIPDDKAAYTVHTKVLDTYLRQIEALEVEGNPSMRIDLGSLMQLPGVLEPPSMERIVEQTRAGLMNLVDAALDQLMAMRRREGQSLADDLHRHCEAMRSAMDRIGQRAPEVVALYHERLRQRVAELTGEAKVQLDADSLAREVALFADRSDISEEISRLEGHLQQFLDAFDSDEPVGRKLDFIAQEMLREANTIASKSGDPEIARIIVDVKSAVDRIKEQVQNIE